MPLMKPESQRGRLKGLNRGNQAGTAVKPEMVRDPESMNIVVESKRGRWKGFCSIAHALDIKEISRLRSF